MLESGSLFRYAGAVPLSTDQIEKEALGMPSEARARLADRLIESLDAASLSQIDKMWIGEARRRREEVQQGDVKPVPGPEGLARVRRSLGR